MRQLSAPLEVNRKTPPPEDTPLGMMLGQDVSPFARSTPAPSAKLSSAPSGGTTSTSLGSKASQSFSNAESRVQQSAVTGGTYNSSDLEKVEGTLSDVSNAAGLLSSVVPEAAPFAGVAGIAGAGIGGIRSAANLATGQGNFLDNAAGILGAATMFAPQLALPSLALNAVNTGYKSYKGGILGDAMDARTYENSRDVLERMGYSRAETDEMAGNEDRNNALGKISSSSGYSLSPDLSSNDPLAGAAQNAFSGESSGSLGSRAYDLFGGDDRGSSDHNVGGERGSSTGTGGGYNDGKGGVTGL